MASETQLEELAQAIMAASVKAEFLGLRSVVQALDMAFSDIVRFAMEAKREKVVESLEEVVEPVEEG